MDIFDQIATGVRPPPPGSNYTSEAQPSMQEQCFGYALAKQVPAMERGFTIHTNYGEIVIEPGRHADAIAVTVRRVLEIQLKAAVLARRDAELDGGQV